MLQITETPFNLNRDSNSEQDYYIRYYIWECRRQQSIRHAIITLSIIKERKGT